MNIVLILIGAWLLVFIMIGLWNTWLWGYRSFSDWYYSEVNTRKDAGHWREKRRDASK